MAYKAFFGFIQPFSFLQFTFACDLLITHFFFFTIWDPLRDL